MAMRTIYGEELCDDEYLCDDECPCDDCVGCDDADMCDDYVVCDNECQCIDCVSFDSPLKQFAQSFGEASAAYLRGKPGFINNDGGYYDFPTESEEWYEEEVLEPDEQILVDPIDLLPDVPDSEGNLADRARRLKRIRRNRRWSNKFDRDRDSEEQRFRAQMRRRIRRQAGASVAEGLEEHHFDDYEKVRLKRLECWRKRFITRPMPVAFLYFNREKRDMLLSKRAALPNRIDRELSEGYLAYPELLPEDDDDLWEADAEQDRADALGLPPCDDDYESSLKEAEDRRRDIRAETKAALLDDLDRLAEEEDLGPYADDFKAEPGHEMYSLGDLLAQRKLAAAE